MTHKLYKKLIKDDMLLMDASGQVGRDQVVEIALEKLSIMDNPEFNKQIETYYTQKNDYVKIISDANEKLMKLINDYFEQLVKDL